MLSEDTSKSEVWTLNSNGLPDRPNGVSEQYNLNIKNKFDYGITGGLGVELNITNSAVKAGTYVLGDGSATSKAIEKAMKDSGLFKGLPDVDLSKYRATVSVDKDGIKTYKITKVPSVKSDKNPDTPPAKDVSLSL
jgi:hypothetical protein